MLIGVLSDTHGHVDFTKPAVTMLESLHVEALLHCGDIGSPAIPPLLAAWPTHYVFGNVDYDPPLLTMAIQAANGICHHRFGDIQLGSRRIALLHSDDAKLFHQVCSSGEYDLVCYGHTHFAEQHREGRTLILNPGALFRTSQHSIAVVDLEKLEAHHVTIN